jgi:hypothetical protein
MSIMIDPLACGPALALLAGSDDRLAAIAPERFRRGWLGLLVISAAWGLLSVGLWQLSYHVCREPAGLYLAPAIALTLAWMLGLYLRAAGALAGFLGRGDSTLAPVAAGVIAGIFLLVLLVLPPDWHRQEQALPGWLAWIRPGSKVARVLILLPLWGAWSCIILPQFRRPSPAEVPQLAAFARGGGPLTGAVIMAVLLAASTAALAFLPWAQLAIPAVGILAATLGGTLLSRIRGRTDRSVLLATNLLTQLTMLLAYLVVRDPRFW